MKDEKTPAGAIAGLSPPARLAAIQAMLDPTTIGLEDVGPLITKAEAIALLETPKDNSGKTPDVAG